MSLRLLMVVLLAAWGLLPAGGTVAKDRGSDAIAEKIERERRALEKLQRAIEDKKKRAEAAERKKESVLQAIQDLDADLTRKRQERSTVTKKLKDKDREIEDISRQLSSLRDRLGDRRQSILARLRAQYMEGRHRHLAAVFTAGSYEILQRRLRYLSAVSQREYDLVESYRQDVSRLEQMERQRESARSEMLAIKVHTERKLAEIHGLKRKKNAFLATITKEKESQERALAELERSAARVDTLLKDLEQRRRAFAVVPPKHSGSGHAFKGTLRWPVDGDVVSFFGRQKHRTFNTYVQRKGIEIRTEEGSVIRAVMAGTVVYADWLKGYGQVVILDHANGLFSLYAHASKILVKVGEQVAGGHGIGETGDTGLTGDSTLYFEIREGAEPVDPLVWLAKR